MAQVVRKDLDRPLAGIVEDVAPDFPLDGRRNQALVAVGQRFGNMRRCGASVGFQQFRPQTAQNGVLVHGQGHLEIFSARLIARTRCGAIFFSASEKS